MRNLMKYASMLIISILLFSCTDEIMQKEDMQGPEITITLQSSSLSTKADKAGSDELNENAIKTVHYFLYPKDSSSPDKIDPTKQPSHWGVLNNVNTTNTTSVKLKVSEPVFNKVIFPRPYDECDVYVIVNLPSGIEIGSDKSLSSLKSIPLEADFSKHPQDLFVMEGEGKIAVTDRRETNAANGVVMVKRVAAKVTVKIEAEESVTIGGTEWKSQPDEINIHFYNGVKNSLISSDPDDNTTPVYFDLDITETRLFYSYPIRWNVGDESEPYFRIMLPWTHAVIEDGTTKWEKKPTYYKVILGGEILERNTWSDVTIRLSAPGNFEDFPDYNVDIEDIEYRVVDWSVADVEWNVGLNVDTEILESRYLVVDNDRHVLNNQDTLRIPYTSSHECEVIDKKIKRPNFKSQNGVTDDEIVWNDNWHIELKQTTEETYIEFVHKLNNDIKSKQIDFAPYTITFRVRHKDADGQGLYYRDVTIIQNPAMMISVEKNEGGNIVPDPKTTKSDDKGYVFVNGNQMTGGDNHWDIVRSCLDGGNSNPNMYVISTTIPFEEYILTDPRKSKRTTVTTLKFPSEGNTNTTKVAVDANGKTLEYYYETIDGDESLQIIAPKFRIASSYGKCLNSISKANARRRCAAYQEQGYPAGRWRIPTHAELKFIATLSNYKIIPELFTPGNRYWTSAGVIYYGDDLKITTQTVGAVRCVYDEWYWEQTETPKVDKTKFTWGDEPR